GIGRLHEPQNERGVTIEISRGNRYAMTLTKLPTLAPNRNAISAPNQSGTSVMLGLHHRHDECAIARPVEFREHHALPAAECELAVAHRNVDRGTEHHREDVRLRVALAM